MARKAQEAQEEWITSKVAAEILTEKAQKSDPEREISVDYVRQLGKLGKIERKEIDARTKLYLKADVESYEVKKRGDGSIRRAARAPRGKRPEGVSEQVEV